MEAIKYIGLFFQNQIFEMQWLNQLSKMLVEQCGFDTGEKLGAALQFFLFDVVKITILLCCLIFIISYIQSYFPPEKTKKILEQFSGIRANIISALLGTVTPFCSCSSIPLFMGLTSAGLSLGVTFSFLISSPMVDLGSLVLLTGIFGAKVALLYVIVGLIIAVIGGTFIEKMNMEKYIEPYIRQVKIGTAENGSKTVKSRCIYAKDQVFSTVKKVLPFIILGVSIGAVIHNWIPRSSIENILGSKNPFGVFIAAIAGIPLYADIFGTIPIAEVLLHKGANLGTILTFMMAVTTLSLPSMILLRKAIKTRLLITFTGVCFIGIIVVGFLFNFLQGILI